MTLDPDALAALEAAATPPPWHAVGDALAYDTGGCTCGPGGENGLHENGCGLDLLGEMGFADAALIAALRNAAPALIDAARRVQAAEAERDELRAERDTAREDCGVQRTFYAHASDERDRFIDLYRMHKARAEAAEARLAWLHTPEAVEAVAAALRQSCYHEDCPHGDADGDPYGACLDCGAAAALRAITARTDEETDR
ncbi:MAG: hypothetical protein ACRCSL_11360 [Microbacterium sp.]